MVRKLEGMQDLKLPFINLETWLVIVESKRIQALEMLYHGPEEEIICGFSDVL